MTGMQVDTSRFGVLDAPSERIICIDGGLLGFPQETQFIRVPVDDSTGWVWLQSVASPELAFLAVDALKFFPTYDFELSESEAESLGASVPEDLEVLALVTISKDASGAMQSITANLLGPVVLNTKNGIARQIVLAESGYSTKTPFTD